MILLNPFNSLEDEIAMVFVNIPILQLLPSVWALETDGLGLQSLCLLSVLPLMQIHFNC